MTDTIAHAVTQPQPTAWALASRHCPVICSDTRPDIARIGELIGIHASSQCRTTIEQYAAYQRILDAVAPGTTIFAPSPRGAIVGVARLKGVIRAGAITGQFQRMIGASVSEGMPAELSARIRPWWRPGTKWGLLLDEAVALSEPIPMRGAGGLWRIAWHDVPVAPTSRHDGRPPRDWALEQWRKGRAAR